MQEGQQHAGGFEVSHTVTGDVERFKLSGELDIATVPELETALAASPPQPQLTRVIDLSWVGFMDSSGLRVLIGAHRTASDAGAQLVVVTGESPAKRVFELTGMDEHIRVVAEFS